MRCRVRSLDDNPVVPYAGHDIPPVAFTPCNNLGGHTCGYRSIAHALGISFRTFRMLLTMRAFIAWGSGSKLIAWRDVLKFAGCISVSGKEEWVNDIESPYKGLMAKDFTSEKKA